MAASFLARYAFVASFILMLWAHAATGFRFVKTSQAMNHPSQHDVLPDISALVDAVPKDRTNTYVQAMELLSSMQSSPSCYRLATSNLLNSCQSIQGSSTDKEHNLDLTKSLYAARLAVCEIISADAAAPDHCKTLSLPLSKTQSLYEHLSGKEYASLGRCLQALESRPQWWTSYSNSRQNAVVICEAARKDIDKDEVIKVHKLSVDAHRSADEALVKAVKHAGDELNKQQHEFKRMCDKLQAQLVQDLEATSDQSKSYFDGMVSKVDSAIQALFDRMKAAATEVNADVATIQKTVENATMKSKDLASNIGRAFQKAAEGSSELASLQIKQLDETGDLVTGLQTSLQQTQEIHITDLLLLLAQMHDHVRTTNDLVASVAAAQVDATTQLSQLNNTLALLQSNTQLLEETQLRQGISHSRLYTEMESGMHGTFKRMQEIEKSAVSLQTTLQDAAFWLGHFVSFAWIVQKFWDFSMVLIVVALLVLSFQQLSSKTAKFLIVAIGLMELMRLGHLFYLDIKSMGTITLAGVLQLLALACAGFICLFFGAKFYYIITWGSDSRPLEDLTIIQHGSTTSKAFDKV